MSAKKYQLDFDKPLTTVDIAIFTVKDEALHVLLVRRPKDGAEPFPDAWALPGGFVDISRDASLQACAQRKLQDKTGVASPYLEQLGSWGGKTRDPRGWSATHAYFALLPLEATQLAKQGAEWHAVDALPRSMAFDHAEILAAALQRLRSKVEYTSLPAFLLSEPFTLPQLQKAYETVLGRAVDKSGFRTRALAADFLVEEGLMEVGSPRPAMGYRLRDREAAVYFPRTFSPRSA